MAASGVSGLRIVGWGPFRLPGETDRILSAQRHADTIMKARKAWTSPERSVTESEPPVEPEHAEVSLRQPSLEQAAPQELRAYAEKEQILADMAEIDASDQEAARVALRAIAVRWEAADRVLRERAREHQTRFDHFRAELDKEWRRVDPGVETRRAQLQSQVTQFESEAANARADGDLGRAELAENLAEQWRGWLATAEAAMQYER